MTSRRFFEQQRRFTWKNTHDTTCPPYGCVQLEGRSDNPAGVPVLNGTRPEGETAGKAYGFNFGASVAPGKLGALTLDFPVLAAVSAEHESYAPADGSWELDSGARFTAVGTPESGTVLVTDKGGGSDGMDCTITIINKTGGDICPGMMVYLDNVPPVERPFSKAYCGDDGRIVARKLTFEVRSAKIEPGRKFAHAVSLDELAPDETGRGMAAPLRWTLINFSEQWASDYPLYARPALDSPISHSNRTSGYPIVWSTGGTGHRWAVISMAYMEEGNAWGTAVAAAPFNQQDPGVVISAFRNRGVYIHGNPPEVGQNLFRFAAPAGAALKLCRDSYTGEWIIDAVEPVQVVDAVGGIWVEGMDLRHRQFPILGYYAGNPYTSTWHTGAECPSPSKPPPVPSYLLPNNPNELPPSPMDGSNGCSKPDCGGSCGCGK